MGKITSDLSVFETMEDNVSVTVEIVDRQEGEGSCFLSCTMC